MISISDIPEPFSILYTGKDEHGYQIRYKGYLKWLEDTEEEARSLVHYLKRNFDWLGGSRGIDLTGGIWIRYNPERYNKYGDWHTPYELFDPIHRKQPVFFHSYAEARRAHRRLTGISNWINNR